MGEKVWQKLSGTKIDIGILKLNSYKYEFIDINKCMLVDLQVIMSDVAIWL
jgi:hypothetical protein